MTNVHDLVASVLYQDVQIAQNLSFSELSMENAILEMPEPLPVASELSVRIAHPDGSVLGAAVVTRVRESRAAGEAGLLHLRWVEFSDADFARLADWVATPGVARPKKPEPVVAAEPEPVVAPEPEPMVAPEPEPVVAAEPEPVVAAEPEPVVAAEPEPVVEPVASIPDGPVASDDERTLPIDPGATMLDLQAIPETLPVEDTSAREGGGDNTGEEISVVDEDGETSSGEASSEEGGATKKRRRRTKKK